MTDTQPQQNSQLDDLQFKSDKGDFSSIQVINKNLQVNGFIRLKNLSALPVSGQVGDICVFGGKVYVCTVGGATATFTKIGTQV